MINCRKRNSVLNNPDNDIKQKLDAYLAENFIEVASASTLIKVTSLAGSVKIPCAAIGCVGAFGLTGNLAGKLFDKLKKDADETFSEMLTRLVAESGEKNSAIYNRAQIDRQLFSRIKNNKYYQPSKDTAVALALALKLDFVKAKNFLAAAGYALTNSSKRDMIIAFFLENKIFDTMLLNDCLYEYEQPVLFGR